MVNTAALLSMALTCILGPDPAVEFSLYKKTLAIIKNTQKLALLMEQMYGILVTSPHQLIDLLEEE